jgi:5-methylcytosine-specific restriction endonuclease McrA
MVGAMAIGPKLRMAVLARDKFTCHYCGRFRVSDLAEPEFQRRLLLAQIEKRAEMTARQLRFTADLQLEVDHRVPTSRGGTDDLGNLVTSCQDCNRGKSNQLISN